MSHLDSTEIETLVKQLETLDKQILQLASQGYREGELQDHIDKLHEYNEVKDTTQIILGQLAEIEGITTREIYQRYNLNLDD